MTKIDTGPKRVHGGLEAPINRIITEERAREVQARAGELPKLMLSPADLSTIRRIGDGSLSPLTGPMNSDVFYEVLADERILSGGESYAWTIPIAFPVTDDEKSGLSGKKEAVVTDPEGNPVGLLEVEDVFEFDKMMYLESVYGTNRTDHPGARIILNDERETLVGGSVWVFPEMYRGMSSSHQLHPNDSRKLFMERGWERIIAFQTRNPLHRAHEYAMVVAVERLTAEGRFAGIVLNPLLGELKSDDVPATVRMKTYQALLDNRALGRGDKDEAIWEKAGYDINDQFMLLGLDMKMFYAGPKEAIMHAIYRQNYGFTDIIIGRKHADAPFDDGSPIWGDFDAQEKFGNLNGNLAVNNLNVGFAAFYEELGRVALMEDERVKGLKPTTMSGTKLREILSRGEVPEEKFMRPETSSVLIEYYKTLKD
ncbi:MAG: sulfate adenylyltransferase [Deltaproteobacteria bacterium]|nr:sulfate adenylyltransferase [Candidatus Zymogenaceae bacterium]